MHDKLDGGFVKVLVATCCSSGYFSSLEVTDVVFKSQYWLTLLGLGESHVLICD